jgi:glycosyltransferase involved in cell wall biosynthesis
VRVAHRGSGGRIARGLDRELLFYTRTLDRELRATGAQLLHCPGHAAPRTGVPFVLTVHDVLPLRHPELFTYANRTHFRLLVAPAARRAATVITDTAHVRDQVVELLDVSPDRVAVVPCGISERFRPAEPDPAWLTSRFGVRGPYLLTVGAGDPRKNVAMARRISGDRQLVAVGPETTGHVTDEELAALYSGADCFLFLSLDEGFGFPPLEAMACGCPVLASARGSLPEVLGDAAVLVEPAASEAADALARILRDEALRADLRARGLERARTFTWEACARATAGVYCQAVGGAGQGA